MAVENYTRCVRVEIKGASAVQNRIIYQLLLCILRRLSHATLSELTITTIDGPFTHVFTVEQHGKRYL